MSTPEDALPLLTEGPPLEQLGQRLQEIPAEFLDAPGNPGGTQIVTAALVHDALHGLGVSAGLPLLEHFQLRDETKANWLQLVQVCCWLLAEPWFADAPQRQRLPELLQTVVLELADTTAAPRFVEDPERREELARSLLAGLGCRPGGETEKQARDRLSRISAVERQRLIAASRAIDERARAIREALAAKAARESADKWTRE